jgi:hypothetical protein
VTITNGATSVSVPVPITNAQAVFWLDIAKCQVGGYYQEDTVAGTSSQISLWASDPTLEGNMVVDMISGSTQFPGQTWVGIQFFAGGVPIPSFPVYSWDIKSVTFCAKGFQMDDTTTVFSKGVVTYFNATTTHFPTP